MKTKLLILIAFYITTFVNAQTPKVEWVKTFGGAGNERANSIETDSDGNIIVVGRFRSKTFQIDKITLTKNAADPDIASDVFIVKLDKNGKALWAVTAGNYGDDLALSCTTDKKGNIYVVGYFDSKSLQLGSITLNNSNFTIGNDSVKYNSDLWLAKFSPTGVCMWAKNAGGEGANGHYSTIVLDKENNVIIGGIAGTLLQFGNEVKITNEKSGMFVAKYTNNGNLLWAKGSSNGECQGVGTDSKNNVYAGGFFNTRTTFGKTELTSYGKTDAYVVKYNSNGEVLWAKTFGGEGNEIATCESDDLGNVYLSGTYFSKSIVTEKGTLTNNGQLNAFIAKFDSDGKLIWAKSAGGNNGDAPATATREFYIDKKGNALCAGSNWSEFTFAGQPIKTVAKSEDIFLLKYDKDGNEIWGLDYGGQGRNAGRGVTTNKRGEIYLTGSFDEKELHINNFTLINAGESDVFILKLSEQKK